MSTKTNAHCLCAKRVKRQIIPRITLKNSMAEPNTTVELKTYKGNCHCGSFKFSINIPELTSVTECNCSICFKKGYKWVFPGAGCFTIEKGDGSLKKYEYGEHSMLHEVYSIIMEGCTELNRELLIVLSYMWYGYNRAETWHGSRYRPRG